MKDREELLFAARAGYAFFYCATYEIEATAEIISETFKGFTNGNKESVYKPILWNLENNYKQNFIMGKQAEFSDPDSLLDMLRDAPVNTVIVAPNWHWFLKDEYGNFDKTKITLIINRTKFFSSVDYRKILVIVGSEPFSEAIPEVLQKEFKSIDFSMPDLNEIEMEVNTIIQDYSESPKFKVPEEKEKRAIISAAKGLTRSEMTKAFSYSIIKDGGEFRSTSVAEIRAAEVNNTDGLSIRQPTKTFKDLIGFEEVKEQITDTINHADAKGVIILGPAGVGKTQLGKAIAGQFGRLMIEVEFAQMMGGGLVGQAEKAWKRAIDVISANANPSAPIVLFVDEIEKGLSGLDTGGRGSGSTDGGTSERAAAQFLKFLSDERPKGIYVVATCNNIQKLPAAYVRTGRWDSAPFMVDLPGKEKKESILKFYVKMINNQLEGEGSEFRIEGHPGKMEDWTGAEIESCCKMAKMRGWLLDKAATKVVPVAKTMGDQISYVRNWSVGRTLPADREEEITVLKKQKRDLKL